VVNPTGHIDHWVGNNWSRYPDLANDIGVGSDGSVWVVGTNPVADDYGTQAGYDVSRDDLLAIRDWQV
jgi:hypothetical protein